MNFYRIDHSKAIEYAATMGGAKAILKTTDPAYRADTRIDLVDLATDKNSILLLLNDDGTNPEADNIFSKPIKSWKGTARGGVVEIDTETGKDLT